MYNPGTFDYFKHPDRVGETVNMAEVLKNVFEIIYNYKGLVLSGKLKNYKDFEQHEFFHKINEIFFNPYQLDPEKAKCSEVFAEYICKVAKVCCPKYLEKILIFVTLFRECLNSMNKKENSNNEYTEEYNAEDAPDVSNEFVTEYLEADIDKLDYQKEEVIEITQNFCQWLYDNNFTCSKLSLISSS